MKNIFQNFSTPRVILSSVLTSSFIVSGFFLVAHGQSVDWVPSGSSVSISDPAATVGIGTSNPQTKLHIVGNESTSPGAGRARIFFEDTGTKRWSFNAFGTGSSEGGGKFGINDASLFLNRFIIDGMGRIGIGTTNPGAASSARLNVFGAIKIGDTADDNLGGGTGVAGMIWFDRATRSFKCNDGTSAGPCFSPSSGGSGNISGSGATGFLAKFSTPTIIATSSIAETGGKIGIGTVSPGQALDVVGSIRASGDYYAGSAHGVSLAACQQGQVRSIAAVGGIVTAGTCVDLSTSTGNPNAQAWVLNGANVFTNPSLAVPVTNVGIGTNNPLDRLHVAGNETAPGVGRARIRLQDTGTSGRSWTFNVFGGGSNEGAGKFGINDGTAGQNRLLIDTTGNIGIGTTNPGGKLEIAASNNALRLKKVAGSLGSVDLFPAIGNDTGINACHATDAQSVCLGYWSSNGTEVGCEGTTLSGRALCAGFGD